MRPGGNRQDTGRRAYREPIDVADDRPVVRHRPFWRDQSEQLVWEYAVESQPRKKPGEGYEAYLERICAAVGAQARGPRSMARLPYRDPDDDEALRQAPPVELSDERAEELARQRAAILADTPPVEPVTPARAEGE